MIVTSTIVHVDGDEDEDALTSISFYSILSYQTSPVAINTSGSENSVLNAIEWDG